MTKGELRILLLEDNVYDAQLLKRQLSKKWGVLKIERIYEAEQLKEALRDQAWDVIISDYSMPQFTGLQALEILHKTGLDIPFIMVSGKMGEGEAITVMRAGAQDYILKDKLERLIPTIERELNEWKTRRLHQQAKEALEESEIAWETTFSAIADSIMLLNTEGIVKQYNQAALNIFQRTGAEILGRRCYDLLGISEEKEENRPFSRLKTTLKREKAEIEIHNRWFEVTLDPILNQLGKLISVVHIMKDITDKVNSAKIQKTLYQISTAVRNAQNLNELFGMIREYLGVIIDTTNIYIAIYDEETDAITIPYEVNEIDEIVETISGKTLTGYVLKHGKPMLLLENDITAMAERGEIELVGAMAKIWLGAPLRANNKTIGVLALQNYENSEQYTYKDLDLLAFVSNEIAHAVERKKAEDKLRTAHEELKVMHRDLEIRVEKAVVELREKDHIIMEQSRKAAIGEMISRIAHHWRQPLNNIGVTIQSLGEALEFGELTEEYLAEKTETAMKILKELSKSIDDFRFLYKTGNDICEIDVLEYLINITRLMRSEFENNNIELEVQLADSHIIRGIPSDFSQAVMNVLTNAYEILTDREITEPKVWVSYQIIDSKAVVSIRDNGGGIAKSIEDKIFELYSSTKQGLNNTGTGLYISRLIIEKNMGGEIEVQNHPEGAEFILKV